ncbi:hypothetical protein ACFQV2_23915 [Actinokineospora soli]|uniref:Uncharacterized protein n=1 Tax=Actinokineospora soli TaxID=1048753 RepID=A0ABW2TSB3_9PSEU
MLLPRFTEADDDPVKAARTFVDAVNVSDLDALRQVTCERDRANASSLFLTGGFRLTLERVNETEPMSLTVLATDTRSGSTERVSYPLVQESGEWLVCSA